MVYRDLLLAKEHLILLQEGIKLHLHEDAEKERQKVTVRKGPMTVKT